MKIPDCIRAVALWPLVRRWTTVEVVNGGTYYRLRTDGARWELQAIGGMGDRKWHPIAKFPWTPLWRGEAAIFWEAIETARNKGQAPLPPSPNAAGVVTAPRTPQHEGS